MTQRLKLAGITFGALAMALTLGACDQQDTRKDRAQTLFDATLEQLSGRPVSPAANTQTPMELATIEQRALAGTVRNDLRPVSPQAPRRFAVGSIIAKPVAVPEPVAMMAMSEPVTVEALPEMPLNRPGDASEVAEARQKMDRAARRLERLEQSRPQEMVMPPPPPVAAPAPGAPQPRASVPQPQKSVQAPLISPNATPEMRKMARRTMATSRTVDAQVNAQSQMVDVMAEFGLSGSVQPSNSGAMVIQIGVDPTKQQDLRKGLTAPRIAYEVAGGCPDGASAATVKGNAALATECVVRKLQESGKYEYVEKDYLFEHQFARKPPAEELPVLPAILTPNDPLWSLQWHFRNNGDAADESLGGAGFVNFWNRPDLASAEDIVVAVIDTGLQMDHPDIANSGNILPGWDMVTDPATGNDNDGRDADPNDPGDYCVLDEPYASNSYHGTHVAGTVGAAATNNGAGVAGGAWQVKIVPVRALGVCGGKTSDINDAIRWAGGVVPAFDPSGNEVWNENPADIINLSMGQFGPCQTSMQEAINDVTARGVIVVAAAGNARMSTSAYAPGGCDNVISVAASDAIGQIAPYSNYGPEVDLIAPGGDIKADLNGDGWPDGVLSTKLSTDCSDPLTGEGLATCYYAFEQGTSMAAPHVSAALALVKAQYPTKTSDEIRDIILAAVDPRTPEQCSGLCSTYTGGVPMEGSDPGPNQMCSRPCGGGLLNLARLPEE